MSILQTAIDLARDFLQSPEQKIDEDFAEAGLKWLAHEEAFLETPEGQTIEAAAVAFVKQTFAKSLAQPATPAPVDPPSSVEPEPYAGEGGKSMYQGEAAIQNDK